MNLICPYCKLALKLSIIEIVPVDENGEDSEECDSSQINALVCNKCEYWEYVETGVVN